MLYMTNKEIKVHNVVSLQYVPKYSLPFLVPHLANPLFFFFFFFFWGGVGGGCRDGAVVRALASHQCGPGSIPRLSVICGLSLLVLYSAPRGTPVFPSRHLT